MSIPTACRDLAADETGRATKLHCTRKTTCNALCHRVGGSFFCNKIKESVPGCIRRLGIRRCCCQPVAGVDGVGPQ